MTVCGKHSSRFGKASLTLLYENKILKELRLKEAKQRVGGKVEYRLQNIEYRI